MSAKRDINDSEISRMYSVQNLSLPDISQITGVCISTIRLHLIKSGVRLRSRSEAIRLNPEKIGRKGVKRVFTDEWKNNIRIGKIKYHLGKAKGRSLKSSGYYEITRGENKGKSEHVVIIENIIGRSLRKDEVVHHENGIRTDNRPENLRLMSRSEHSRIHAMKKEMSRSVSGRFVKQLNHKKWQHQ